MGYVRGSGLRGEEVVRGGRLEIRLRRWSINVVKTGFRMC